MLALEIFVIAPQLCGHASGNRSFILVCYKPNRVVPADVGQVVQHPCSFPKTETSEFGTAELAVTTTSTSLIGRDVFQCTPVRVVVVVALFGVALARDSLHLEEEFNRFWRESQVTLSLNFGRLFIVRCRRRLRTPSGMINLGGLNEMSQLGC
jgi:hypothetical protein